MPITYDPASNTITVVGFTAATPCSFEDLYNADKAGALTLVERTGITEADTEPVDNTYPLRPADDRVMGGAKHDLWLEIENFTLTEAVIRLIGKDEAGNDQTEDITVTGNGIYYSEKIWTELTKTQVISVTGTGSFDYRLVQGRWGVIWKIGENEYFVDANLNIGDYETPTYFAHEEFAAKIGRFDDPRDFRIRIATATFVKGRLEIHEYNPCPWRGNITFKHCVVKRTNKTYIGSSPDTELYAEDCYFEIGKFYPSSGSTFTLYRCWIRNAIDIGYGATVRIPESLLDNGIIYIAGEQILEDVAVINPPAIVYDIASSTGILHLIDSWFELNRLKHRYEENITWVKHRFHIKVTDKQGNPVQGADVYLYDKDGNEILHEVTDINGEIPVRHIPQYKITGRGTGEELTVEDFNPYTLIVEKFGYTKYEGKITIDRPIKNVPIVLNALYTYDELLEQVKFIRKVVSNDMEIKDNQLTIYDDDGVTPLIQYDLFDKFGNPAEINVFKRKKKT